MIGIALAERQKVWLDPNQHLDRKRPANWHRHAGYFVVAHVADRINNDRTLRLNAQAVAVGHASKARSSQAALIQAKEQANLQLEQRVLFRTNDLKAAVEQLSQANARLQMLSTTDGLTQIGNRAFFDGAALTELRRAERQRATVSSILLDIDHFKRINDTFGHPAGDACMRALTGVDLNGSVALAEELRKATDRLHVELEGKPLRFTASFGVVSVVPQPALSLEDLVSAADCALYEAKRNGRNCVRHTTIT